MKSIPQIPLKDIDFQYFVELMLPFIEDGAVKHIYIEEAKESLNRLPRYDYNMYVIYGNISEYNKSFDIKCGEMTIEGGFNGLIDSILTLVLPECKFTRVRDISKTDIDKKWVKII